MSNILSTLTWDDPEEDDDTLASKEVVKPKKTQEVEEVSVEDGIGSGSNAPPTSVWEGMTWGDPEDEVVTKATATEEETTAPKAVTTKNDNILSTLTWDDADSNLTNSGLSYKEEEDNLITSEWFELPAAQNSISKYLVAREGKSGARQEGESTEEYAERYFTHMRWLESNLYHTGKGISWLGRQQKVKEGEFDPKANFALLYTAYKDMPGAFSEGGGSAFSAVQDYIYASILDPVNVVTLGSAMGLKLVGGRMAGQVLLRNALKDAAPRIALSGAVDTLMGAIQEGAIQTVEQRAKGTLENGETIEMRTDKDFTSIATMGLLNGTLGTLINVGTLKWGAGRNDYASNLRNELRETRLDLDANSATYGVSAQDGALPTSEAVGRGGVLFEPERATELLAREMDETDLAHGVIKSSISEEILKTAGELMRQIPDLRQAEDEQLSDALLDVIAFTMDKNRLDDLSPYLEGVEVPVDLIFAAEVRQVDGKPVGMLDHVKDVVEKLNKTLDDADLTQEEFAQMTRASVSESGTQLGVHGQIGKVLTRATQLSKAERDMLDPSKGEDLLNMSYLQRFWEITKGWDRARRAIITMMPITTIRNIGGAASYMSMETATRVLVETAHGAGKAVRAVAEGRSSAQGTKDGFKDIVKNSFSLFGKMMTYGDNRALAELIVKDHAKLEHALLRTTQEAGENELSKSVRFLNSLNIAQDQYIRSGVFVDSIERQLTTYGLDAKKILAQGKHIPAPVVKKAVDDALTATFSAPAKNAVSKSLLKAVENLPFIATAEFPFLRFMMNAIHFQYKYSPLNVFSASSKHFKYKQLREAGNPASARVKQQAAEEYGRTVVGSAMLIAAIKYRSEHQDTSILDMYSGDGEKINVSALYPLPAYLAMGDLLYKMYDSTLGDNSAPPISWRDFSQGTLGLQKAPFENAGRFFSEVVDMGTDEVSQDRMGEVAGKFVGGLFGQYMTPAKLVSQILTAFNDEESIVRDPNGVEGEGFMDSAIKRGVTEVQRNLPFVQQSLPARTSVTSNVPLRSDFAPVAQVTGLINEGVPTKVESELEKHGIKLYFITARTGNKKLDQIVRKNMSVPLNTFMERLMNTTGYESLSRLEKEDKIRDVIARAKNVALVLSSEEVNGIQTKSNVALRAKASWEKLTSKQRALADERYIKLKTENDSFIPFGGSATSTIYQDKRWLVGKNLIKGTR